MSRRPCLKPSHLLIRVSLSQALHLEVMRITWVTIVFAILTLILGALLGYGGYRYVGLAKDLATTTSDLASTTEGYFSLAETARSLQEALRAEQERNGTFASQITQISSTVGTLDKLAKTDKELLAKYSKIYFLSEHYIPTGVTQLSSAYAYPEDKKVEIAAKVAPYLTSLMEQAAADDIDLRVTSGYRSFSAQASLKTSYKVTYGTGANSFSADQGYSEHQLGTTLDFTTKTTNGSLPGFDKTPAYTWLLKHAHEHGFVLSYPKGNAYYQYEPWHWRFVGINLATRLHQDEEYFYNLDQREIDEYLVWLFNEE